MESAVWVEVTGPHLADSVTLGALLYIQELLFSPLTGGNTAVNIT